MIRYYSTRGQAEPVSFREALLQGLAPDGGLFVPDRFPSLPDAGPSTERFDALALGMLTPWLADELPGDALANLIPDALDFPVPLVPLGERHPDYAGIHVLELYHGPTHSFKDFGARFMARCMGLFLQGTGRTLTVLVATSGDTGSAVADGFAGQEGIRVVLLYPKGGVSEVQERQLIVERRGVSAYAVKGDFDDCQRLVKAAFGDPELAPLGLTSANSINIGRLLPQMTYYGWAVARGGFERAVFCIPSGNLGNLTAGCYAREMGLPVARFVAAHNANDFFPAVLQDPEARFRTTRRTLSNAMDVGRPSNYERLTALFDRHALERTFWGTSVDDTATRRSMRAVFEKTGYVADPHTAVGLEAAARFRAATGNHAPIVVLATAHPAKFPEVVAGALDSAPPRSAALEALRDRPVRVEDLPPTLESLKSRLTA